MYTSLSLSGTWRMNYSPDADEFLSDLSNAFVDLINIFGTDPNAMDNDAIENAVPGYWEDMTEAFKMTPFYKKLRINPEYGIQQYPIAGTAPDMALPNIVGSFIYQKYFDCENITPDAYISFGGVQNTADVWINGTHLGHHEGYSTPFEFKIPDGLLKETGNNIMICVSNFRLKGYDDSPVSGLTSRAANEYTGGITGDVEIRFYSSPLRDAAILISPDCKTANVELTSTGKASYIWRVVSNDKVLKEGTADGNFSFDTCGLDVWSPESPVLYTLEIECGSATLRRRFGVRRLLPDGSHFKLNGSPYFLRGVCEHCYFPETIHPDHNLTYYRSIIKNLKKLGFNFIRFHTYIPEEEYMQAADELGMLLHVESPNNTSLEEWEQIVTFCRRHTSVVIYCCGNELQMDDPFIAHLNKCADAVHQNTDSLFSPMSAMRGLEYCWIEPEQEPETKAEPFKHHPRRFKTVGSFSDMYSSYTNGIHSYLSLDDTPETIDKWNVVYQKPRVSHEICIDGTYTDLSLKDRYKDLRVGKTDMFSSLERHLESKGMLHKAPLYFANSSEWQRRVRKHCFEKLRMSEHMAGYDFLGPIDTHWHTFGYDVGMMNEFYELKPGESVRNVLMYNSETVLLCSLDRKTNFASKETLSCTISASYYGKKSQNDAQLTVRLCADGKVIDRQTVNALRLESGNVVKLFDYTSQLPQTEKPLEMKLYVTLDGDDLFAENEWELYLFPSDESTTAENLVVTDNITEDELISMLEDGKDILLLGAGPLPSLPTSFRNALAGRTSGNLATLIADHPAIKNMPHDGFCGWQFNNLLEGGSAVCFECDKMEFNPIIEVVSTHKFIIRQSALFELKALNGRLLVCSMNFDETDPAANYLKSELIKYASGNEFNPKNYADREALSTFIHTSVKKAAANTNFAFNANDKTSTRKKK